MKLSVEPGGSLGALETHHGDLEAHPGATEAQLGAMDGWMLTLELEAHAGAWRITLVGANPGATGAWSHEACYTYWRVTH
jgi:hypothetical protein